MPAHDGHVAPVEEEQKYYAPNVKNAQLTETEEEAHRLFKKRQRDSLEELEQKRSEQARLAKQSKDNA